MKIRLLLAVLIVGGSLATATAADPPGFRDLFNGRDFDGWVMEGPPEGLTHPAGPPDPVSQPADPARG